MWNKIKNLFILLLFAIPFGFVTIFLIYLYQKTFLFPNDVFIGQLLSGFCGAFFAFIFIRIGDAFTRLYERSIKNVNALVKYEFYFNGVLSELSDNKYIGEQFISIAKKAIDNNQPIHIGSKFCKLPIENGVAIDLTNLQLINEIMAFVVSLQKLNKSINTFNESYDLVFNAFSNQKMNLNSYLDNLRYSVDKASEFNDYINTKMEDAILLAVKVRLLAKNRPPLSKFIGYLTKTSYPIGFNKKVIKEQIKFEAEIESNAREYAEKHKMKSKIH